MKSKVLWASAALLLFLGALSMTRHLSPLGVRSVMARGVGPLLVWPTTVTITDRAKVMTGKPSVSPDGKWIAFAGQRNAGQRYDQEQNDLAGSRGWCAQHTGSRPSAGSLPGLVARW